MNIEIEVENYLEYSKDKYQVGEFEYYGRIALEQALFAFRDDNYGIGAVSLKITTNEISEYRERNAMVSGVGVIDHAETRALIKLKSNSNPDKTYSKHLNKFTEALPTGIVVFGTLEPCPMCACTLSNSGAILSVSNALDGTLVILSNGFKISDGAANVIGEKKLIQPKVWQNIQSGLGLTFELLQSRDAEISDLSNRIFLETREKIDDILANRNKG